MDFERYDYDPASDSWRRTVVRGIAICPNYFAQGSMRNAHKCTDQSGSLYVAKFYRELEGKGPAKETWYFADVRVQIRAMEFAAWYNATNPPEPVTFIPAFVLRSLSTQRICTCEPFIPGRFEKYNNNNGYVRPQSPNTPQAFSHFSYEYSSGTELVCDIQGVIPVFTDPQIHSLCKTQFSLGNLGEKGVARFFMTHVCNDVCHFLGLNPPLSPVRSLVSAWSQSLPQQPGQKPAQAPGARAASGPVHAAQGRVADARAPQHSDGEDDDEVFQTARSTVEVMDTRQSTGNPNRGVFDRMDTSCSDLALAAQRAQQASGDLSMLQSRTTSVAIVADDFQTAGTAFCLSRYSSGFVGRKGTQTITVDLVLKSLEALCMGGMARQVEEVVEDDNTVRDPDVDVHICEVEPLLVGVAGS